MRHCWLRAEMTPGTKYTYDLHVSFHLQRSDLGSARTRLCRPYIATDGECLKPPERDKIVVLLLEIPPRSCQWDHWLRQNTCILRSHLCPSRLCRMEPDFQCRDHVDTAKFRLRRPPPRVTQEHPGSARERETDPSKYLGSAAASAQTKHLPVS